MLLVAFIVLCCILGCLQRYKKCIKKPKARVLELRENAVHGSTRSTSSPYGISLDVDVKQRKDEPKFMKTNSFYEIQGPPEYSTLT